MMASSSGNRSTSIPRVFCIGLSKTGTSSLVGALQILGLTAAHFPPGNPTTLAELRQRNYALSVLQQVDAVAEGVAPYYQQFDRCFPGSKFILTTRALDSWLVSVERHWPFVEAWAARNPQFDAAWDFVAHETFGTRKFDRNQFADVYQRHTSQVRQFFADRGNDLLVIDICRGDGWPRLCPFLECDQPDQPFPHVNREQGKAERSKWIEKFDAFEQQISTLNANGEPFVLVDNNTMSGSRIYRDLRAQPFLMRHDAYFGLPEDSDHAWRELQTHRSNGARMIVFSWDAFWWFEHYSGFTARVTETYPCVARNRWMRAYQLTDR